MSPFVDGGDMPSSKRPGGFYWCSTKYNPRVIVLEWLPECGEDGRWFESGVEAGYLDRSVMVHSSKLIAPERDIVIVQVPRTK